MLILTMTNIHTLDDLKKEVKQNISTNVFSKVKVLIKGFSSRNFNFFIPEYNIKINICELWRRWVLMR